MLLITLLLMGVPTILIGLIPSYEQIGYWAAVLLVLMRFLQGIAVGGEWGGAVLMAVEHAPGRQGGFSAACRRRRGAGPDPVVSAMGAVASLPEADMLAAGWRPAVLPSVVLLLVGWFIRAKVAESPDFEQMKEKGAKVEVPVAEVLKHHRRALLVVVGARLAEVTWFYTVVTFSLAYATGTLGIARSVMLDATIWGAAVALFTMPVFGMLGDKIGHKWVFMAGTVGILACAPMFFQSAGHARHRAGSSGGLPLPVGLVYACLYGPEGTLFSASSRPKCATRASRWRCRYPVPSVAASRPSWRPGCWRRRRRSRYVVWYLGILGVIALFSALADAQRAPRPSPCACPRAPN